MTGPVEAVPSAAAVTGRKLRVLAVHGGYSNSNILKFQMALLRKALGRDVEWLLPDAKVPRHPYAEVPENNLFPEISAFEARLAQGKPLVSWWLLRKSAEESIITDTDTMESSLAELASLVAGQAPVDVAVGFSQGSLLITLLTLRLQREGRPVPWRLLVLFCPSDPTSEITSREFTEPLRLPVLHITSPGDPHYSNAQTSFGRLVPAHLHVFLEHPDGYAFPTTPPHSTEIYRQIATEVDRVRGGPPPAPEAAAVPLAPAAVVAADVRTARGAERKAPDAAAPVDPEELARLLLAGVCLVVDTRQPEVRGSRLLPGCNPRDDVSFAALQRGSRDLQRRLAHLRRDGRMVVAVSGQGELDREYCELLSGTSGLPAGRVRWLEGGLQAWASWELDCPAVAEQVRLAAGLPARREPSVVAVSPADLAAMLREGGCLVADAREAAEARGKAFPGARKGVGLLSLRRRPVEAAAGLAELREDGRPVVVVSVTGGRCQEYCALLVDRFDFEADLVRRLDGGLRGWVAWELENPETAEDLRRQYGLPPARCRLAAPAGQAAGAAERAHSVEVLGRYS